MPLYAIFFYGALGATDAQMKPAVSAGPFPTETVCYGAAALGVSGLNGAHPTQDFRAVCSTDPSIVRRPGQPLLALQDLAARAGVPLGR